MIDIVKQTPSEYSAQSRDYQVIARLYTALYNSVKSYVDNMQVWNKNIDNRLTTLRCKTLNFTPKHQWDLDSLDAAVSCFKYLMRKKGTTQALQYCLTILMRVYKLVGTTSIFDGSGESHIGSPTNLIIRIPVQLQSTGVVQDLLDYILPAGVSYRLVAYKLMDSGASSELSFSMSEEDEKIKDNKMGIYNGSESSEGNQGYRIYRNVVQGDDHEITYTQFLLSDSQEYQVSTDQPGQHENYEVLE